MAPIKPASISLSTATPGKVEKGSNIDKLRHSPLIWLGLGVLITASIVVVFLLPQWVSTQTATTTSAVTAPIPDKAVTVSVPQKKAVSPWEKAQESRLRQETQSILSKMLDAQKLLADKGVELWAGEEYAKAMQYAGAGDEKYNARDFAGSRIEYERGLEIFEKLVTEIDLVFEATMEKGERALSEGNAEIAREAFDLALAIDEIDRAAGAGRARADTIEQVFSLKQQADDLLENEELNDAKKVFQQALDIDSEFEPAREGISKVNERILEKEFNQHMSDGFSAMDKRHYSTASKAFNQALKLKPRSAAAKSALEQSRHKQTTNNINNLMAEAAELEARENWHQAKTGYESALKLNSNLAAAQEGLQRTTLRSRIHDKLEQVLSQPKRLFDPQVLNETKVLQSKLEALSTRGPVLKKQLSSLAELINKAQTPVPVLLQSDGQTSITLRKVGELGTFAEKNLDLRPGKYIAIGVRPGYRDARVEFLVDPDQRLQTITILASEKIALGR